MKILPDGSENNAKMSLGNVRQMCSHWDVAALKSYDIVWCTVEGHMVITLRLNMQDYLTKVHVFNSHTWSYMVKISV
jgi:hypothetical protein